ncbi:MAG TPA: hypothetical protein VFC92_00615 [Bacteroidales bacterium]|nr:hypothetical protein [Bacteroidales bacterium]
MSWCPVCSKNTQIVVSSHTEPGYGTVTTPRCSICYSKLRYPGAQTAKEIDDIYKEQFSRWKSSHESSLQNEIYHLEDLPPPPKGQINTGCLIKKIILVIGGIGIFILFSTEHWVYAIMLIFAIFWIFDKLDDSILSIRDDCHDRETKKYNENVKNLSNLPKLKSELQKIKSYQYTGYDYKSDKFCYR